MSDKKREFKFLEQAISLVDKPEPSTVPENFLEMQIRFGQERGVM